MLWLRLPGGKCTGPNVVRRSWLCLPHDLVKLRSGTLDEAAALERQAVVQRGDTAQFEQAPRAAFALVPWHQHDRVIRYRKLKHPRQGGVLLREVVEFVLRDAE